jgi:ribosome recycling factor
VASVTVPEARMLVVQPWDKGILKDIEKAINMSDLGLVPMNDGNLIRMAIPQLTEQRRKDLVKVVNKKAEEAKVAIRNIRRDGNVFLKKEEKNSDISKDVIKDMEDKIQKLTDQKIKDLEAVTDKKVKEILSV